MSIFQFDNYRDFLRSYVRSLPKNGHGELSRIAKHLGVSSTTLSQILSGTKNFSTDHAFDLAEYLQLTEVETDYLYILVEIDRAATKKNQTYLRNKLIRAREEALKLSKRLQHEKVLSDAERASFYSSWIFPAAHLFLGIKKEGATLEEVMQRFNLPRQKTSEILQFFLRTGLAVEREGRYRLGIQSTFVEQGSPHLLRHHANWRVKAIEKSENIQLQELMYTNPVSVSRKDFDRIREKIVLLLKEISLIVKESPEEEVANLNIDWFWVD